MELNLQPIKFPLGRAFVWLLAVAWFSGLCWWHRNLAIDDAWITFRYAQNVASGHGFVFNVGEPLEGYSNFLWVIFSTVAVKLNLEPLGVARAISWLSVVVGFALLIFGTRARRAEESDARVILETNEGAVVAAEPEPFRSATAALLLAAAYPLAVWTMAGLETAFYAMLLLALVIMLNALWQTPTILKSFLTAGLLVALAMTRIEGAMWGSLLFIVLLSRNRSELFLKFALPLFIFLIVESVYTNWRLHIFGHMLPNTVTAKVNGEMSSQFKGLTYAAHALGLGLFVPIILAIVAGRRATLERTNPDAQNPYLIPVCAAAVVLQTAFVIFVGGDWMPAARFFVPIFGPLFILAALALRTWPVFVRFVIVVYLFAANFLHARGDETVRWCRWEGKKLGDALITEPQRQVGVFLRANAYPTDVLAATEAGVVPYYSQLPFIDMLGLVDLHIASLPGGLHEKYDAKYVLSRAPDLILLGFEDKGDGQLAAEWAPDQQMIALPEFAERYVEVKRWPRDMDDPEGGMHPGWMVLYKKRIEN